MWVSSTSPKGPLSIWLITPSSVSTITERALSVCTLLLTGRFSAGLTRLSTFLQSPAATVDQLIDFKEVYVSRKEIELRLRPSAAHSSVALAMCTTSAPAGCKHAPRAAMVQRAGFSVTKVPKECAEGVVVYSLCVIGRMFPEGHLPKPASYLVATLADLKGDQLPHSYTYLHL